MILVNNQLEIEWEDGMTIRRLLERCRFTAPMITVFVNGELVPREEYDTLSINDGDEVRAMHFIGGG